MLVSLVVPCYNEEEIIELFYAETYRVIQEIKEHDFEFIFIDDGSNDRTLNIMRELAAYNSHIKYISLSRNFGKEAAMYAGLSKAKGDVVAIMDADMQDPPSLLPEMLKTVKVGYDSVATRRVTRKGEPPIRSIFAYMFYKLINRMSDIEIVDGARDYRLMTRKMVNAVLLLNEHQRFSKGIFGWVGFKTKWIEYENIERAAGETKWSFWKLFKYAVEGIVAFSTVPLRFASFFGFGVSIIAFLYLIFVITKTAILGIDAPGYASTIAIILFLGGIMLFSIGILGEYVARIYMEVKARPIFIIQESNTDDMFKVSEHYRAISF